MKSKNKYFLLSNVPKVLYENRYCNQEGFSILVCGGLKRNRKLTNQVLEVKFPSFEVAEFQFMTKPHVCLKVATIHSEIFAFFDSNEQLGYSCTSVEVYSEKTKSWKHHYVNFEERFDFCLCSFMGKLYIIGGSNKSTYENDRSCYTYDIKSNKLNKMGDLSVARHYAACTVFEGKIVVAGGYNSNDGLLKSVEAFDYYENKWTYLQDMIEERFNHASVSMGNKLFVIGGYNKSSFSC